MKGILVKAIYAGDVPGLGKYLNGGFDKELVALDFRLGVVDR